MSITLDDILQTYPMIAVLGPDIDRGRLTYLLGIELAANTCNRRYADALAEIIVSHAFGDLYSSLSVRQQAYRAAFDLFVQLATPATAPRYLRGAAMALEKKRDPETFRRFLLAHSRRYKLDVPSSLKATARRRMSEPVHVRLPVPLIEDIKARCAASGRRMSDYVRDALYDYGERN